RHLKLWAQAIARLDLAERQGARVRQKLEKFFIDPHNISTEPLPLGAIYVLRAALLLRRGAYRPRLVRQFDQKAAYFHAAARIANIAGIYHLTRVLDFAAMPDVIASLERHWQDLGIMESAP